MKFLFGQLVRGNIYIEWLGAAWFIIVLFQIFLLRETVSIVYKNPKIYISLIISFIIGCVGILLSEFQKSNTGIELTLITQFLFMCGRGAAEKKIFAWFEKRKIRIVTLACNVILFICFMRCGYIMDIATEQWPNPILAVLMILNGVVFLYIICKTIVKYTKIFRGVLVYIGKNTLGILLFHFACFKMAYLLLYMLDLISKEDIALLCPAFEIGNRYWWLITSVSIGGSLFIWEMIKYFKVGRIMIGQDKQIGRLLEEKVDIKNPKIKKIVLYLWGIFVLGYCVQQIDLKGIYSEWLFEKTKKYTIEGIYGDCFLGETAVIKYTATADAVMNIELNQTEELKENTLKVYIEGECLGEYQLFSGNNEISIKIGCDKNGEIELVFEKNFVPDEITGSGDERKLTCQLVTVELEKSSVR